MEKKFRHVGHVPTLLGAFLYFDVSFMIWMLIGSLGVFIAKDFDLSGAEKGLLVAVPLLGGSLLRLPLGMMADRVGSKKTALIGMALSAVPLVWATFAGHSLYALFAIGLLLGIAGASFAVALPMASRWYPPEHQGFAMGIAGAGNSGTVLAAFFSPRLAEAYGWHAVFGFALIPLLFVMVVFAIFAKDSPNKPQPISWRRYAGLLKETDSLLFCIFYMVTFGGFVGMASFLPLFFADQYGIARVSAGNYTALCVLAGSLCRPLGGFIADRVGGVRSLSFLYLGISLVLVLVALLPPVRIVVPLLFVGMLLMGMGNGAVFQIVPQRFPQQIGTITGLVGSAGGLGGFFLPLILSNVKATTHSYATGFLILSLTALIVLAVLRSAHASWRRTAYTMQGEQPTATT